MQHPGENSQRDSAGQVDEGDLVDLQPSSVLQIQKKQQPHTGFSSGGQCREEQQRTFLMR